MATLFQDGFTGAAATLAGRVPTRPVDDTAITGLGWAKHPSSDTLGDLLTDGAGFAKFTTTNSTPSNSADYYYGTGLTNVADASIFATLKLVNNVPMGVMLTARSSTSATTWYAAYVSYSGGNWNFNIFKFVAGTGGFIGTAAVGFAAAIGDVLNIRFDVNGTSLSLFGNVGAPATTQRGATITDTAITGAGSCGIRFDTGDGIRIDRFDINTLSSALGDMASTFTVTSVTVAPATASVAGNASATFTATVAGTGTFTQSVSWTATAGSFASNVFTAPIATSTAQTITVTATSTQDATKSGTATVTVPAVTVAITGAGGATSVAAGSALQLTATGGTSYAWLLVSGGGTISGTGLYTPPGSGSGTSVIRATDTTGATNTISIAYSAGVGISLTASQSVNQLATLSVTATVINAASTAVTFSGSAAALLTGSGITQTLTAPASTTAQTYTLIATSVQDNTKTATSVFTVPAVSVTVSSTTTNCPLTGTVSVGVATVAGSTNTAVTYTTPDGGTYSAGTFTPPTGAVNAATYRVISTASADTTKIATITVTMTSQVVTYVMVPLGAENTGLTVLTVQLYNPTTGAAVGAAQTPTIAEVTLGSNTASGTYLVPVAGAAGVVYLVTYSNAGGTVSTQDALTLPGGSVSTGTGVTTQNIIDIVAAINNDVVVGTLNRKQDAALKAAYLCGADTNLVVGNTQTTTYRYPSTTSTPGLLAITIVSTLDAITGRQASRVMTYSNLP